MPGLIIFKPPPLHDMLHRVLWFSLTEPAAPGPDTSGVYELWNLEMKTNPEDWIKLLRDSSQELESESRYKETISNNFLVLK